MRIFTHFLAKNHSKLTIEDKNLIQQCCLYDFTPNLCFFERVIALFHHFFLRFFLHIVEIGQKAHNTTTSRPPVPYILQILATFNLYSGRPRVGLSVNNKQKVRQVMVKISRERVATTPLPGQICQSKWLDHRRVNYCLFYSCLKCLDCLTN